jgi:hypothetical protein
MVTGKITCYLFALSHTSAASVLFALSQASAASVLTYTGRTGADFRTRLAGVAGGGNVSPPL